MASETGIGWTDATFNPWWGCERVSPACAHCYADTFAKRYGFQVWGGEESGRRFFSDKHWNGPVNWNAKAEKEGKRKLVFCASMADVFEDRRDLDPWRDRLWALIEATPWLRWQLLTKRPEKVMDMVPWGRGFAHSGRAWPYNVWIGTSIENARQTWRADALREIPCVIRFLSCEPLLDSLFEGFNPVKLRKIRAIAPIEPVRNRAPLNLEGIDWVISGGESGPRHRTMKAEWVRELRDACADMDIPYFFKQWGGTNPKSGGKELDGREWCEIPDDPLLTVAA